MKLWGINLEETISGQRESVINTQHPITNNQLPIPYNPIICSLSGPTEIYLTGTCSSFSRKRM
jgi:hypothetical protein